MKRQMMCVLLAASMAPQPGCKEAEVPKGIPACIKKEIQEMRTAPVRNPAGSVWQYEYEGRTVYFIPSYCCDIPSRLISSDCHALCSPDGGLTGSGDGRCPEFFSRRTGEKLIWKDSRK